MGPETAYAVPLAPVICVVLGAAALALVVVDDSAADDVADVVADVVVPLVLVAWLHPAPIMANAAIAAENAAVRFVVARISYLQNWFGPAIDVPKWGCYAGSQPPSKDRISNYRADRGDVT